MSFDYINLAFYGEREPFPLPEPEQEEEIDPANDDTGDAWAYDYTDLFFFGEIGHSRGSWVVDDLARFNAACEWGKPFGVDGIIRMEWELYVIRLLNDTRSLMPSAARSCIAISRKVSRSSPLSLLSMVSRMRCVIPVTSPPFCCTSHVMNT